MLILLILTILIGGGYYYMQSRSSTEVLPEPALESVVDEQVNHTTVQQSEHPEPIFPVIYYVADEVAHVYLQPQNGSQSNRVLYQGDDILVYEIDGDWLRISDYMVYQEGQDAVADWVYKKSFSLVKPVLSGDEHDQTIASYISRSDDIKLYEAQFIEATKQLFDKKICHPSDLVELGGWVKSLQVQSTSAYFIYCRGMNLEDKIYLDIKTGQLFDYQKLRIN